MAKINFEETARKLADEGMKYIEERLLEDYGVSFDELEDIVKAKQDGRLVVLPCKVGDNVWVIREVQDGKCTREVHDSGKIKQISINSHGKFLVVNYCHTLNVDDIGKTVFLSPEKAKQALKGE